MKTEADGRAHIAHAEARARAQPAGFRPVRSALLAGCGNVGAGLAFALDAAGIAVHVAERPDAVARCTDMLGRLVDDAVARGLCPAGEAAARKARLAPRAGLADRPPAQIAIEAVDEDPDEKARALRALEAAAPEAEAVLTCSASLPVDALAGACTLPARLTGLRIQPPAHLSRLAEIAPGPRTAPEARAAALSLAHMLDKLALTLAAGAPSPVERLRRRMLEVAEMILLDGSVPWEVDAAMEAFGFSPGPFAAQDITGLDADYVIRRRAAPTRDPARRYVPISDRMVQEGRLGRKVGVGWYRYPGGGGAVIDPLLEDMITEEARFARVSRREFDADQIRTRLIAALVNEAAAILDEGVLASAAEIDLVSVHALGFPRARGGLLWHADRIGLARILDDLTRLAREDPAVWTPAPLLARLVAEGPGFTDAAG
ncbi:hypothetical protein DDZ14_01380 [Maritimibacter sp. 55A14]|uniref:3-hydroxyacyl-CoA dehydrogenase n=1 Tax=Maritimibacter sp. 55A14 TaxID=2174844 RepID=UPI000D61A6CD|nr:3-hydroxyacyl-CoA dehydrogenase family protein [Maritimibacter sp. 55A14]PWE34385.1 hypothetical protein DDZ14_01380 [Maritimibacter sp. 55A14]